MLWLDLKYAIEGGGDNFTVKLFQLLLKSDTDNFEKLSYVYPIESNMVWRFKNDCPYKNEECTEVNYERIEKLSQK
jgi:hypothetical protein